MRQLGDHRTRGFGIRLAVFTAVLIVSVLSMLVRDAMRQENREAARAVDRIAMIQASSADLILEFDTSIGARTPANVEEFLTSFDAAFQSLESSDGHPIALGKLIDAAGRFRSDLAAGVRLTLARQWDAAEYWRGDSLDVRYRALMQSATTARTELVSHTEGNGRVGDIGSVIAIVMIAVAVGTLIAQLQRYSVRDVREAVEREMLSSSEARFRGLVQYASDIVAILDADKHFTYLSPSFERLLRHHSADWLDKKATEIIHPDDHVRASKFFRDIQKAEPGTACVTDLRIFAPEGSWRWFEVTGSDHSEDPAINGTVINARETTDRRVAELEVERFRSLIERNPAVSFITAGHDSGEWAFVYVSPQLEEMLGLAPSSWIASKDIYYAAVHSDDRERVRTNDILQVTDGLSHPLEYRFVRPDGRVVWVSEENWLVRGTDGAADVWQGRIVDITAEHDAIDAAREAEDRFRALVEQMPAITVLAEDDRDERGAWSAAYISPQLRTLLELPADHVITGSNDWLQFIHPDDRQGYIDWDIVTADGHQSEIEYRFVSTSGRISWVRDYAQQLQHNHNGKSYWLGVIVDVTQAHLDAEARRSAEQLYQSLVEQMPAITFVWKADEHDPLDGAYQYMSPRLMDILGYDPEEWVRERRVLEEITLDEDLPGVRAANLESIKTGNTSSLQFRARAADGSIHWLQEASRQIEGGVWHGLLMDYTETKATESAAQEAELRFRALVDQLPAGTYVSRVDEADPSAWTFRYRSQQFLALLGCDESCGPLAAGEWRALIHHADVDEYNRRETQLFADAGSFDFEYRIARPAGGTIWIREITRPFSRTDDGAQLWLGVIVDVTAQHESADALRAAEHRFRTLIESLPAAVYTEEIQSVKVDWTHLYMSPQIEDLLGYPREVWTSDPQFWATVVHPADRDRALAEDRRTEDTGEPFSIEYRLIAADGHPVWIHEEAIVIKDEAENPLYWQGIMLDITAKREVEEELRQREEEFRLLFSRNPQPTWVYDEETLAFLEVNDAACLSYGYTRDEFLQKRISDLAVARLDGIGRSRVLPDGARESRHFVQHGRIIDVEITSHRLMFRGRAARLEIAQDVTTRNELQAQLSHQAFHDALTGLPNRSLFTNRLQSALTSANPLAVLFIDLDNFKVINDTLGHDAGDSLLLAIGQRLVHGVRPTDTVARLGGDEFTILLDGANLEDAIHTADRLIALLAQPMTIDGHAVTVTPSIGIAMTDVLTGTSDELLRRADVAMYKAKGHGKGRFVIFDSSMDDDAWKRLSLEGELRRAISSDQLSVHYQPIVDLQSGTICEVEALVRWSHPEHGLVSPLDFIPLAEETGLIVQIGAWVLEEACAQVRTWQVQSGWAENLRVAVNLSVRQFVQTDLVESIQRALDMTGLPPSCLKLEITESVAIHDIPATRVTLQRLKAIGVQLAIDDFGTGYSGLSYLQHCPVDSLKIDRSYVDSVGHNVGDRAMIQAVMAFARTLGLTVTAEGVETTEQLANLRRLGVDEAQGYYFSPPLPREKIAAFLEANRYAAELATPAD